MLCRSGSRAACLITTLSLFAAGCAPEFDATFDPGADATTFGTLIDDRGTFEFILNPATGNIQRVETDEGTLIAPTDGQDLSVERANGSSVTLSPTGESDVLVAIRNDEVAGSTELSVPREALGDLGLLVRPNAARIVLQDIAACQENQEYLDGACEVTNSLDLDEIAQSIHDALESRGQTPPPTSIILGLLERYLGPIVIDCCLAWDEFRSDGAACAGS